MVESTDPKCNGLGGQTPDYDLACTRVFPTGDSLSGLATR